MNEPVATANEPIEVTLAPGAHAWCSCGLTKTPPFCDGAHRGTPFRPKIVKVTEQAETLWLCQCKRTQTPPLCDGSHCSS